MVSSITQIQEKMLQQLEKIFIEYSTDMTKLAEWIQGVTESVLTFARCLLAEELESYDSFLCKDKRHRPEWKVVKKASSTLLTSLGSISYHKTLFQNVSTGEYQYLLDQAMGLESYARMTEDAEANLLIEAVQTSYEKGGENVSIGREQVSRETVKNKIHRLEFPKKMGYPEEKKVVNYLYIDADIDDGYEFLKWDQVIANNTNPSTSTLLFPVDNYNKTTRAYPLSGTYDYNKTYKCRYTIVKRPTND